MDNVLKLLELRRAALTILLDTTLPAMRKKGQTQ